ncbi:4Fe-4S ferredoxin [Paenibacillus rhizosphaerae]|uniref:Ferredoxin n=3 Tax=Paenibacillus TaxID=44249 RepID=A0A1R1F0K4_9BACL|nr:MULTISPECIES: 4Fe-4S binding protein [Paenibacillus]OMF57607.1 4Fe-4S ferredoxin [Paenibacillus rhizosphaerae]OXL83722.1 4Fe-4S ferredoxin [Paenibacillus sp. SSG-1]
MPYVITSGCIDEKAAECVDVCPVDCIEEGPDQFFIEADICIECGACEVACPVGAVFYDTDVPDEEKHMIQKAEDFYKS